MFQSKGAIFETEETSPTQKGYLRNRRNVPNAKRPKSKGAIFEAKETSPLKKSIDILLIILYI